MTQHTLIGGEFPFCGVLDLFQRTCYKIMEVWCQTIPQHLRLKVALEKDIRRRTLAIQILPWM